MWKEALETNATGVTGNDAMTITYTTLYYLSNFYRVKVPILILAHLLQRGRAARCVEP